MSSYTLLAQNFTEIQIPGSRDIVPVISPDNFHQDKTAKLAYFDDAYHVIIRLPVTDKAFRAQILNHPGFQIGNYLGDGFYRVAIDQSTDLNDPQLDRLKILPVPTFDNALGFELNGLTNVRVLFPKYMNQKSIRAFVNSQQFTIVQDWESDYHMIDLSIDDHQLTTLLTYPFVIRIDEIETDEPLDLNSPMTTRSITQNAKSFATAKGLTGEGVVVGVGDAGEVTSDGASAHVDRNFRITNETTGILSGWGFHGEHIVGSISGLGNKDPQYKGMAPNASVITEKSSNIIYRMDELHENYGITLVNCSFGPSGNNCANFGTYNSTSVYLDDQMNAHTDLLYVIAAGNSGSYTCNGYAQQFNTVLQSYASAKNPLVVAACDKRRRVYNSSVSAGPVRDGRLKPEISAPGTNITSTGFNNAYEKLSGSSMATANVTG
ncbi:MAG: S8 family serine peptidase, partial [Bacteroidota bacterium]